MPIFYRVDSATTTDCEKNDNKQNILGGGIGIGYQIVPFLGAYADYGTILSGGPNDAGSNVNMKKIKPVVQ